MIFACAVMVGCSNGGGGQPNWVQVQQWQSENNGDSPIFKISTDVWRVVWNSATDTDGGGLFVILVYNSDGTFLTELFHSKDVSAALLNGTLVGVLQVKGPGEFFVRVETTRPYEITVEEGR